MRNRQQHFPDGSLVLTEDGRIGVVVSTEPMSHYAKVETGSGKWVGYPVYALTDAQIALLLSTADQSLGIGWLAKYKSDIEAKERAEFKRLQEKFGAN